jgi:hypothetical protein
MEVSMSSMFSGAVTGAARLSNSTKHFDHAHPRITATQICVDWNDRVSVPDLVPVIQSELNKYRIASQVYQPGDEPGNCETVLYYAAARAWDVPLFGSDLTPYVSQVQLVVRQHGQVIAQASYDVDSSHMSRWSDTQAKVAPLVEELIYGGGAT